MFVNPFRSRPKTGSDAIFAAIGEFESIAARIEAGVADNKADIEGNKQTIAALEAENATLAADAARGESVASKLRGLLA
jgi:hypothetical protein